tara:strand:+ start:8211 stop:8885 length:675 start_codon:yes stop_codon:yes gene_type:complete
MANQQPPQMDISPKNATAPLVNAFDQPKPRQSVEACFLQSVHARGIPDFQEELTRAEAFVAQWRMLEKDFPKLTNELLLAYTFAQNAHQMSHREAEEAYFRGIEEGKDQHRVTKEEQMNLIGLLYKFYMLIPRGDRTTEQETKKQMYRLFNRMSNKIVPTNNQKDLYQEIIQKTRALFPALANRSLLTLSAMVKGAAKYKDAEELTEAELQSMKADFKQLFPKY